MADKKQVSKFKDIGQITQARYKFSSMQQTELFDDFARYKSLFESKITSTEGWPWDYTLFNPIIFSTIRNFVSRTTPTDMGLNLQAWNEEDRPKTTVNQSLLLWEMDEAQMFLKMCRGIFSAGLYGKGFLETGWLYKKEKMIEEVDDKGKIGRSVIVSPKINRADLGNVRTQDIFIANDNIAELQKQPWLIIKRWRTIKDMERINESRGGEVYIGLDKLKDKDLFVNFVDYGYDVMNESNNGLSIKNGVIPILEMWDMEQGTVIEMVEKQTNLVLRNEENPFYHGEIPLVDITFFPQADKFWSPGLVQPSEDLQMAMNDILNQYMTNSRQQLNNMWINGDVRIPDWEFVSRPNGIIHASGNIDQIREVQHKDITNTVLPMLGEVRSEIARATSITDYFTMGIPQGGVRAAAAMQLEENNLDENLKMFMALLEQGTIRNIAKQFLSLNRQFITDDQVVRIAGNHGYRHMNIKADDVSAGFDPIIIPNSTLPKNAMVRLQNLIQVKQMADQEQQVAIDKAPIWEDIVKTMGLTDLDTIIPDDLDEAMEENDLLKKGIEVDVEPNDNHKIHKTVHQFVLLSEKLSTTQVKAIVEHVKKHDLWELAQNPKLIDELFPPKNPPIDPNAMQPGQAPIQAPMQPGLPQPGQPIQPQAPVAAPGNAPVNALDLAISQAHQGQQMQPQIAPTGQELLH